ncbi:hypothetical protein [Haloarchaeobius sp. DFWS5]|uniref:hypothetical protein n=1 Tax=Haloarchaeobius sp. DFWS5 TaxID=3446114 RepID=UPI003EBB0A53
MTGDTGDSERRTGGRVLEALVLVFAVVMLVLGVGQLTDTITYTLPGVVYFAFAALLLGQAYRQQKRS